MVLDSSIANVPGVVLPGAFPEKRRVEILVRILRECEQVEMPVTHRFSPGIYTREIFMPADTYVIGHIHKTRHLNVVLTGRASVLIEGEMHEFVAPCVFESGAGVQKVLHIHEDCRWMTIHANPGDSRDVAAIEETLVELSPEFLKEKGDRALDVMRMAKTRELNQRKFICP